MTDITYPLFPIFAFLGFIVSLIPLPWHLQAWNSGTCYYMLWASITCLNQFINAVVWADNALNPSPAWCEISIRIIMGSSVGLPLASLCINRRLYLIANVQSVSTSSADKTRAIIIDTILCVLLPILFITIQYIVQGHRFNIFEDIGCYPALYNSLPTYFLSSMWPIIIGLISATYCVLSLRAFARRRLEFSHFLHSKASSLTMGRYFRLMALATTEILFTTPIAVFTIWLNATATPINPWRGWADTHFNYSRVEQYPAFLWRQSHLLSIGLEFSRWIPILCALVFFLFFGFADEAKRNYRKAFFWAIGRLGFGAKARSKPTCRSASIGQFNNPKSSLPIKSYSQTSSLPLYSPPPSSVYPMSDLKRTHSVTTEADTLHGADVDTEKASVYTTHQSASLNESISESSPSGRFTWKSISLPLPGRRYSSHI